MNVLIAGPAGYVGRRLLARFEREDRASVRVFTPDARRIREDLGSRVEVVEADPFDRARLQEAVRGIDVAYYPVRYLSLEPGFEARSAEFARMFRDLCIEAGVKRIVYLGTKGAHPGSPGTTSVLPESAEILSACPERIQTLCLFPGVILGPGSAFYEMLMSLVGRVPVLFLPRWTKTAVRPVALSDTVECLVQAASLAASGNARIEMGEDRTTLADLLRLAARLRGVSRVMVPIPADLPRLSAVFLALATPFSFPLSLAIVRLLLSARGEPLQAPAGEAGPRFPGGIAPLTCEEAMRQALAETEAEEVEGRWTDSLAGISYHASEERMRGARHRDVRRQDFGSTPPHKVFLSLLSLGGERGWFTFDVLWRLRGVMDKFLGGFGLSLGRRSPRDLRIGDMLDVWRVVDLVEDERLLLEAQMKVFGEAWLEFRIQGSTLVQTAYYEPEGLPGALYWYSMLPFHAFIFPDMARSIVKRAGEP